MPFNGIRSNGRPKGAKNKKTVPVEEMAAKYALDPFEVLLKVACNDVVGLGYEKGYLIDMGLRITAAKEASKYLHAQKRAVEIIAGEDAGIKIVVEDYKKKSE